MKIRYIIVLLSILLSLFLTIKAFLPKDTYLIPKEDLIHTNIESLEIIHQSTNRKTIIDNKEDIGRFASLLMELNTENIDVFDNNSVADKSIYDIYITNNGRYTNTPIIVFDNSLVYKDKIRTLTSKELLLIIQLLDTEMDK